MNWIQITIDMQYKNILPELLKIDTDASKLM